ncbi:MAG TPA: ECF transporter S component [Lactobacillus sp.]|nr:ECF transporter S component [Lactobacillus sp.]
MSDLTNLRRLTVTAMLIALTVVISRIFIIPIPMTHGNINLSDAGILIAAMVFGPREGAIVGGLSGLLLDLLSGYGQYMFFSLIIHGLEGLIAGKAHFKDTKKEKIIFLIVGLLTMVTGYFIADTILYSNVYTGLIGIPTNIVQGVLGAAVAWFVAPRISEVVTKK